MPVTATNAQIDATAAHFANVPRQRRRGGFGAHRTDIRSSFDGRIFVTMSAFSYPNPQRSSNALAADVN
jgi:hypothetical protein